MKEYKELNMKTRYFSFGQKHTHSLNGHTLDKNCMVKITAENPREIMVEHFQHEWAFEYTDFTEESLNYFPRGVYNLTENKWEWQK